MMDEYCTQELVKRREELKMELNRTIGERNSALEELARVTEERDNLQAKLDEAVDKALELAKERDALQDKLERSIELPLDADGVPWHIGDVVDGHGKVRGMGLDVFGWHFVSVDNAINPELYHHAKPRTVEDVLREFRELVTGERGDEIDDGDIEGFADEIRELLEVD